MFKDIINSLPNGIDGLMIVSPENRLFFTSFESSDGVLIITKGGSVFLTDSRYIEAAQTQVKCCDTAELHRFSEDIPKWCGKFGCSTLGVEGDRLTVNELKAYRKAMKPIRLTTVGTDVLIDRLRKVKNGSQVELIVKAQSIAERAFHHILGFIKEGMTEKEISLELDFFMLKNGADALSFETIAVSGMNSSKPHGVPSQKRIERGDLITMDYGAVVSGYHSDMTRTIAVGEAGSEQIRAYNTVLASQMKTLSVIGPGVRCADADKAARDVIAQAGYEVFRHGTGHGVGVEIHEKPVLSPRSKEILQPGNVVTVEPGIYIPGQFGIRIEDMALITDDGYRNLTTIDKQLIII